MKRRIIVLLTLLLLIGLWAGPVQAGPEVQTGGPLPGEGVYIVQRGDTLAAIAQRYGLTVDAITHANGLPDPRRIYVGQRLTIPRQGRVVSPETTVPYVIQAGDTLFSVARRYHTTWQTLVQINGMLSPDIVHVGQVVQAPSLINPADADDVAPRQPDGGVIHIVRPEDTLLRIALRYDVSPWVLMANSHVANPNLLYPGQEMVIPGEGPSLLPTPFAAVEILPLPVAQGSTMVIAVRTTEQVSLEGELFGQSVRFGESSDMYYGLVGVHVFTEPGLYELKLSAVDAEEHETQITADVVVEAGRFGYERINASPGLMDPAIVNADRERLDSVRYTFSPDRHWDGHFERPCPGSISSYFGSHRSYNGSPYTSYHSGVDFRAPGGTPVQAPVGGTVVLAEPLSLWGNAVVIDHGWGLLTGYAHLSKIEVKVGQQVAQGDVIARVGNTGLSTGSHLHWEMWAGGVSVNGLQWLEEFYPWPERFMANASQRRMMNGE